MPQKGIPKQTTKKALNHYGLRLCEVEDRGVEPLTSCMPCKPDTVVSDHGERLTSSEELACTAACTSEPKTVKAGANDARDADPLKILAAEALRLSNADRQRLLVMLAASLGE